MRRLNVVKISNIVDTNSPHRNLYCMQIRKTDSDRRNASLLRVVNVVDMPANANNHQRTDRSSDTIVR